MGMEIKVRIQLGSKILFQPDKSTKIQINFQKSEVGKNSNCRRMYHKENNHLGEGQTETMLERQGQRGHRESSETRDKLEGVSIEWENLKANLLNTNELNNMVLKAEVTKENEESNIYLYLILSTYITPNTQ